MKQYRTKGLLHNPIGIKGAYTLYELSNVQRGESLIKGYTLMHKSEFIKSFYSRESALLELQTIKRNNVPKGL